MPPLYILLLGPLILFSSLHAPSSSAADDTLTAGQALAAGDKLVSRNGKFALGFFQPSISKSEINTTSPSWFLGIWFNRMPVCTPVWVANRENPITAPDLKQTQLKISGDGNLVVSLNNATEYIIWSSTHIVNRTDPSSLNTSAVLLNSGNLALVESPSNATLWQSFDYPTDIVLPGAKFGRNKVTGLIRQVISKKSLINPGLGSYSIELDASGLVLKRRNPSVVYWFWSSQKSVLKIIPLINMILDMDPRTTGLINPVYVNNNEEEYYAYTLLNESSSTFMSLDISGQIMINVWSQAGQSWQSIFANPLDPCTPYATCGPFTICSGNSHPFCDCMEGFSQKSPQDWELDDRTGGCVRNTPLECTSKKNTINSTDVFHPIARVTLPYEPQSIDDATTQSKCAEACLNSCSCTAYTYNSSGCSVWHGELLSVNLNDGIEINSEDVLYLRLAAKDSPSLRKDKRKPTIGVVTASSIISFGLLMLILLLMIWRNKFKWHGASLHDTQGSGGIIAFRYTDLGRATKNFSEHLGAGGFGSVFKGLLSDLTTIAVKRLEGARQGEKQFRAEVSSLGLIQHINLVKLIGFCCEGDKRLLVYEHMLNGSLDAHLFESSAIVLNWDTRCQIAIGVARGLSYLHQSCHKCIIHCDIKPQNILLDASFVPKIADFGMAAVVGREFSRVLTTFRGTVGYLAPEWLSGVAITPKVDVYSFGMVLLEIISGRRNSPEINSGSSCHVEYFPMRAIRKLHEGDVQTLMDPQLHGNFNLEEAERVCKVACWCIQDNEHNRPTMGEAVQILEGLQEVGMPPMPRLLAAITECSDGA
ncbi:G-type lectin S-receptor-like serine/threonine-protein kinase At2g19130 isoform X1 [Phragmites australis]|uniref:G-type lectin S-receptor-like serine/threonine-protein kinase At2g19130 isoform X1 n=1 Tax=Phragmites australis TaxID=29695 RepID=UPI002D78A752|nr:G-type lectin S-receptor-like serine/threonine-protein kinase At2g19130 isoform X1 [Phragmites australis]